VPSLSHALVDEHLLGVILDVQQRWHVLVERESPLGLVPCGQVEVRTLDSSGRTPRKGRRRDRRGENDQGESRPFPHCETAFSARYLSARARCSSACCLKRSRSSILEPMASTWASHSAS
jgi:hypothetical protein